MAATAPKPIRPAQGFTTQRAQKWVMTSALLTAVIFIVRRMVEPATSTAKPAGKLATLTGAGEPANVAHWAVSYGIAYFLLAMLAVGAPEAAASLAMLIVVSNVLANGTQITSDLTNLESSAGPKVSVQEGATAAQYRAQAPKAAPLAKSYIPTPAPFP